MNLHDERDPRAHAEWLGEMLRSDRLREGVRFERDVSDKAQVVVVGSGAGGAVLAHALVQRGHSVVLLEEGPYRAGRDFRETSPVDMRLYRDAGHTGTDGPTRIPVPRGRAVGGTTAIGMGICERPSSAVLDRWAEDLDLEGLSAVELDPYFAEIERNLHVAPVPRELLGRNARRLEAGASERGLRGGPMPRSAPHCLGTGSCTTGCPQDAKQSMLVSYVPDALAGGATLYTHARVDELLVSGGRVFGVTGGFVDGDGRPTGRRFRMIADRVVLACGAIETPRLLAATEGVSSGHLGRHLRLQPAARVAARYADEIRAWEEVPQSYGVSAFEDDGVALTSDFAAPAAFARELAGFGSAHRDAMSSFPCLGAISARISDESEGRVTRRRDGSAQIRYRLGDEDRSRLVRALLEAARLSFAAGAEEVFSGVHSRPLLSNEEDVEELERSQPRPGDFALSGWHPMGTARMASDERGGVTTPLGEVGGIRDLHVADASLLPTTLGVGPQLTISALSLRIAEHMSAELGAPL